MGTKLSPIGSSQSGGGTIGPTTPTDFTEGSVIFAGASELAEDNAGLSFNSTTNTLTIAAPAGGSTYPLELKGAPDRYYADLLKLTSVGYGQSAYISVGNGLCQFWTPTNEGAVTIGRASRDMSPIMLYSGTSSIRALFTTWDTTTTGIRIALAAAQTADAFQVHDSSANTLFKVKSSGNWEIQSQAYGVGFDARDANGYQLTFDVDNAHMSIGNSLALRWWNPGTLIADIGLARSGAGILKVTNGSTGAGALHFEEQTAPSAPSANNVYLYAQDNGAGKTQLMARFATGAAQQIAIEP